jgi:hypothetical protein
MPDMTLEGLSATIDRNRATLYELLVGVETTLQLAVEAVETTDDRSAA